MRRLVIALALGSLGGCSLVYDLGGYATTSGPGGVDAAMEAGAAAHESGTTRPDAKAVDGPDGSAAPDASVENLHPNGNFEGSLSPWGGFQGAVDLSPVAHSGTRSLHLCIADGVTDYYTADDRGTLEMPSLGTYRVAAWLRTDPGSPAPPLCSIVLRTRLGGENLELAESDEIVPSAAWQRVEATLVVTKQSDSMNVYVVGEAAPKSCFLIDDVVLERLP